MYVYKHISVYVCTHTNTHTHTHTHADLGRMQVHIDIGDLCVIDIGDLCVYGICVINITGLGLKSVLLPPLIEACMPHIPMNTDASIHLYAGGVACVLA